MFARLFVNGVSIVGGISLSLLICSAGYEIFTASPHHFDIKQLCRKAKQELNDVSIGRYPGTDVLQEEKAMRDFRCPLYCPYVMTYAAVD